MKEKDDREPAPRSALPQASIPSRRSRPGKSAASAAIERSFGQARPESAERLNRLLADHFVLYVRTLNYHWNLRGMQFHSLHSFLEEIYRKQLTQIDDIAERVRTLGSTAIGTLGEFLRMARIREQAGPPPDPRTMLATLAADYESILRALHEGIQDVEERYDDPATVNFLTNLLETHEKTVWMLRVHLDLDLD